MTGTSSASAHKSIMLISSNSHHSKTSQAQSITLQSNHSVDNATHTGSTDEHSSLEKATASVHSSSSCDSSSIAAHQNNNEKSFSLPEFPANIPSHVEPSTKSTGEPEPCLTSFLGVLVGPSSPSTACTKSSTRRSTLPANTNITTPPSAHLLNISASLSSSFASLTAPVGSSSNLLGNSNPSLYPALEDMPKSTHFPKALQDGESHSFSSEEEEPELYPSLDNIQSSHMPKEMAYPPVPTAKRSILPPPSLPPTAVTATAAKQRRSNATNTNTTTSTYSMEATKERERLMRKSFLQPSQNSNTSTQLKKPPPPQGNNSSTKDQEKHLRKQLWQQTQMGSSMRVQVSSRTELSATKKQAMTNAQDQPIISAPPTSGTRSPPRSPTRPATAAAAVRFYKPFQKKSTDPKEQEKQLRKELLRVVAASQRNSKAAPFSNQKAPCRNILDRSAKEPVSKPTPLAPTTVRMDAVQLTKELQTRRQLVKANGNSSHKASTRNRMDLSAIEPVSKPSPLSPPRYKALRRGSTGMDAAVTSVNELRRAMLYSAPATKPAISKPTSMDLSSAKEPAVTKSSPVIPPRYRACRRGSTGMDTDISAKELRRAMLQDIAEPKPVVSKPTPRNTMDLSAKEPLVSNKPPPLSPPRYKARRRGSTGMDAAMVPPARLSPSHSVSYDQESSKPDISKPTPRNSSTTPPYLSIVSKLIPMSHQKQLRKDIIHAANQRKNAPMIAKSLPSHVQKPSPHQPSAKDQERQMRKEMLLQLSNNRQVPRLSNTSTCASSIAMPSAVAIKKAPPSPAMGNNAMDFSAKEQERQLRREMVASSQRGMQVSDRKLAATSNNVDAKEQERQLRREMVASSQKGMQVSDRKIAATSATSNKVDAKEQERQLRREMVASSQRGMQVSDCKVPATSSNVDAKEQERQLRREMAAFDRKLSAQQCQTPPRSPVRPSAKDLERQYRRIFLRGQPASQRSMGVSPTKPKKKKKSKKRRGSRRQLGDFLEQQEASVIKRAATVAGFAAASASSVASSEVESMGPAGCASVAQTVADPHLQTAKEREKQFRRDFLKVSQASQRSMQAEQLSQRSLQVEQFATVVSGTASLPEEPTSMQSAKEREQRYRKGFLEASQRSMQVDDGGASIVDETAKEHERQYRREYIQASQRSVIEHEINEALEVARLRKKERKKKRKKKKKRSSQLAAFLERGGNDDVASAYPADGATSVVSSVLDDRTSYSLPARASHAVAGEFHDSKERERQYRKTFLDASQRSLQDVPNDVPQGAAKQPMHAKGSSRRSSRSLAARKTPEVRDTKSVASSQMNDNVIPPADNFKSTQVMAAASAEAMGGTDEDQGLLHSSRSRVPEQIVTASDRSNDGMDDSSLGNYSAREWSSRRVSLGAKFGFTSARERMKAWMAGAGSDAGQGDDAVENGIIPVTMESFRASEREEPGDIESQVGMTMKTAKGSGGPPIDLAGLREAKENEKMGMSRGRSYSKISNDAMDKFKESERTRSTAFQPAPDHTRRRMSAASISVLSMGESERSLNDSTPSLSAADAAALREAKENEKMGMARGRSYKRIANEVMQRMNESERSFGTANSIANTVVVQRQIAPRTSSPQNRTNITTNFANTVVEQGEISRQENQELTEDLECGVMNGSQSGDIAVDITVCRPELDDLRPSALDANPNLAMRKMFDDIQKDSDHSETNTSEYDGSDQSEGEYESDSSGSYESDSSGSSEIDEDEKRSIKERERIIGLLTEPDGPGMATHGSAAPSQVVATRPFPRAVENVAQPAETMQPTETRKKAQSENPAEGVPMYEDPQPLALEPGAYSRTPGNLVRNPNISYSLLCGVVRDLPAQPLASMEDDDCLSVIDEGDQSDGTASLAGSTDSTVINSNGGLIEAVAVDLFDEDGVVEAAPVDLAAKEAKEEFQRRRTKKCKIIAVLFLIVSAVIISVSIGLGKKMQDDIIIEITGAPTPSPPPTDMPTPAPTIPLDFLDVPNGTQAAINDPTTPQRLALEWIHEDSLLADPEYSEARKLQRFALACIYFANGGDKWEGYGNWLNSSLHECQWFDHGNDPMCGTEGEVVKELVLYGSGLTGTIPPQIALLTGLTGLDLQSNKLVGSIPSQLDQLTALESLQLGNNELSGQVPKNIYTMSNLRNLGLQDNALFGSLPSTELSQLTGLEELWLSNNHMVEGSIPSEIGLLTSLTILGLNNNKWNGTIPTEFGSMTPLRQLWLSKNLLTGPVPSEIGLLSNLTNMTLHNNFLSQTLPTEIGKLSSLEWMRIYNNRLTGPIPSQVGLLSNLVLLSLTTNELSQAIPDELWQLTHLRELRLDINYLSGSISSTIGNFSDLFSLSLHTNQLTGPIPTELGIAPLLDELLLGANQLTGTLPTELGLLSNLFSVDAAECLLTGTIPEELSGLRPLRQLWLLRNVLTGTIPTSLSRLRALEELLLDVNFLNTTLPSELGLLSNSLRSLTLGQNDFTGILPTEVGQLTKLEYLAFYDTLLSSTLPTEIGLLGKSLLRISGHQAGLYGALPSELGELLHVQDIVLAKNSLTGTLPTSWLTFSALKRLHLGENALIGSILPAIGWNLTSLEYLHLGSNCLTGSLPPELVLGLTNLNTLWLSSNSLTGSIPTELGLGLQNLTTLVLSGNQLGYSIPTEIGELSSLKNVVLNENALTGQLPSELGRLEHLEVFQAYKNQLTGRLPSELGMTTTLLDLVLSFNDFTGAVPTELSNLVNLTRFHLNENGFTGTVPAGVCELQWKEMTVDCESLQCTCGCTCD